ncbi:DUF1294 domain-containing protein [Paenibacillus flagellatus]|uniref:DUF1294 domain-containing protein n=1 Tax=Paenibacillus flagellatus TaxID=2211139 RepID=A0A2V5KAT1_9BACL|nr:DUF1294 domain-containing protein [Paenibacillus flagellatus]PYI56578.1 DUF1294 domain-containing protein [Paenibacillus flagellatus]
MAVLLLYLLVVNAVGFFLFGYDKVRAVRGGRRVPEKRLFLVAAIGGAAGAWIAMRSFRHKTKHASFTFGIPALLGSNVVCVALLLKVML